MPLSEIIIDEPLTEFEYALTEFEYALNYFEHAVQMAATTHGPTHDGWISVRGTRRENVLLIANKLSGYRSSVASILKG